LAGWGALAGLVSGVLAGAVMAVQGMFCGFGLLGYGIYARSGSSCTCCWPWSSALDSG
jgi:hypothetical protein